MTTSTPGARAAHGPVPLDATDPRLVALLQAWLPERRWFPAKGADAVVTGVGTISLADPKGQAQVLVVLLRARTSTVDVVLQVPVTLRRITAGAGSVLTAGPTAQAPGSSTVVPPSTLIGTIGDPLTEVHDACGDPAFLRAWLAVASGPTEGVAPVRLALDVDHARVLSGEQSNTSVIVPGPDGGAILKVFRALSPGLNPDVELPRALAAQGWWHVPPPLGWLEAEWPDGDTTTRVHLAVLSQFIPDAADGFELACEMAGRGESFGPLAEELGAVIAEMHAALAAALPVKPAAGVTVSPADIAAAVRVRFQWAASVVPSLARYAGAVDDAAARAAALPSVPPSQRIHGDLHLGQALRANGTWFVTDFEGEPLAPISTRARPDLALRDVAGVLRSFDYAAAVGGADEAWTTDARDALLRGYRNRAASAAHPAGARAAGLAPDDDLLRAVELERALYEAVYEARNRPTWVRIPDAALRRLLSPLAD